MAGGQGAPGCPSELHKSSALPGCAGRLLLPRQRGRNQGNVRREKIVEEIESLAVVPGGVEAGGTALGLVSMWSVVCGSPAGRWYLAQL